MIVDVLIKSINSDGTVNIEFQGVVVPKVAGKPNVSLGSAKAFKQGNSFKLI